VDNHRPTTSRLSGYVPMAVYNAPTVAIVRFLHAGRASHLPTQRS
jgi:hypothetical protein